MTTEHEKAERLTTEIQALEQSGLAKEALLRTGELAITLEREFDGSDRVVPQEVTGLEAVATYLKARRPDETIRMGTKVLDTIPDDSEIRDDVFSLMGRAQEQIERSLQS
ncbi:MAG: hypothetical protein HYT10_03340 [Candidatus Levybacteria bacterium]|nr:hypothetical protein [Candidatus Levybacteria bacterium]